MLHASKTQWQDRHSHSKGRRGKAERLQWFQASPEASNTRIIFCNRRLCFAGPGGQRFCLLDPWWMWSHPPWLSGCAPTVLLCGRTTSRVGMCQGHTFVALLEWNYTHGASLVWALSQLCWVLPCGASPRRLCHPWGLPAWLLRFSEVSVPPHHGGVQDMRYWSPRATLQALRGTVTAWG